ncbi:hypothetical protein [Bacillus phage SDFMU_Pbc]|uniref:Uncharacterized protein n=1 Tax=Bacillus phage SDFMU_Pbc TaxID=3076135 RepID=A0AA96KRH6_9CAUD|nr:hypothetical protein [Bacillus phage SDFMU_Pbc]
MKLTPEMFEVLPEDHPYHGRAMREAQAFFIGFKPAITMDYFLYSVLLEEQVEMDHLLHEVMYMKDGTPYGVIFFNNEEVRQGYQDQLKETDKEEQTVMMGQLLGYPLGASKFFSRLLAGKEENFPKITVEFAGIYFISSRESIVEDIQYLLRKHEILHSDRYWNLEIRFSHQLGRTLSKLETDGNFFSIDSDPVLNLMGDKFDLIEDWVDTCFDSYHKIQEEEKNLIEKHRKPYNYKG